MTINMVGQSSLLPEVLHLFPVPFGKLLKKNHQGQSGDGQTGKEREKSRAGRRKGSQPVFPGIEGDGQTDGQPEKAGSLVVVFHDPTFCKGRYPGP